MNNNHQDRGHSRLGASSSKRWMSCPASVVLSEGVDKGSSVYAAEGTAAHECAERCLLSDQDAKEEIGLELNGFTVTEEMAEAVQVYLDFVRSRIKPDSIAYIEAQFELEHIDDEMFGTNDCAIYDPFEKLTIIDYKHGKGIAVNAKDNPQLLYYASGALKDKEVEEVEIVIVQPRADHPDGPIRSATYTMKDVEEFEDKLRKSVKEVRKAEKAKEVYDFASAGDHCRFCAANGFCKALKNKAYEIAATDFDDIEVKGLPEPKNLTEEQLSRVLNHTDLISNWVKSVQEYAHSQAEQGHTIEGFKLVKKRANRKWKDEFEVLEKFQPILDEKDFYTKKLKSPAQLEKLVGKETIEELTEVPDSGTSLVKDSDKRKAIAPSVQSDFEQIEISNN